MAPTPEVSGHGAEAATPPLPPASLPAGSLSTSRAEEIICPSALHPGVGSGSSGPLLASLAATSLGGGSGDDSEGNYCINLVSACAAWKMQMPSWRMHTWRAAECQSAPLAAAAAVAARAATGEQDSAVCCYRGRHTGCTACNSGGCEQRAGACAGSSQGMACERFALLRLWHACLLLPLVLCCAVLCCAAFHCLGRVRVPRLLSCAGGVCTSPTTPHAA